MDWGPAELAALHGACFTAPRPWSAAEFRDLLGQTGVFLVARPEGFALGRVVLDEAELLTLAVAPEARRQGIGAALLAEFCETAKTAGAARAFLEVAEGNAGALALYRREAWHEIGRRRAERTVVRATILSSPSMASLR